MAFVVTYDDRDKAKTAGLRWDPNAKHWYAPDIDCAKRAASIFKRKT